MKLNNKAFTKNRDRGMTSQKKLKKSSSDQMLTGICGGIAEYLDVSLLGVRLIFIFLPANIVIYNILVMLFPDNTITY